MAERTGNGDGLVSAGGRPYHIGVGEVAPSILLVGDPARAERCAGRFAEVRSVRNREFATFTGVWEGLPVTVMATGIGCDNTEIAVVELSSLVETATLIRAGTCGGIQPDLSIGDLVITWGAVRLENTSTQYVPEGYPAVAHPAVIDALCTAAAAIGAPWRLGMTATAPGFYGAQGREVPGFPARYPDRIEELARIGVLNLEMETSTLLTLASLRGLRAGAVCTVFAERGRQRFVAPAEKHRLEDRAVEVGLRALRALAD